MSDKGTGKKPAKSKYSHKNVKGGTAYDPKHPTIKKEIELSRALPPKQPTRYIRYSEELGEKICNLIASWPRSIKELCDSNPDLPDRNSIMNWRIVYPEFNAKFTRAKQMQIESYIDETIHIADDDSCDLYIDPETGEYKINNAAVARAKIRIDIRKWQASKLMPHVYGDKQTIDTTVTVKSHEQALKELEGEVVK